MLRQSVINEAILDYIHKNIPKSTSYNLSDIAKNVMDKIRQAVNLSNGMQSHEKWKIPDKLGFTEIALIINELYTIRRISFLDKPRDEDDDILGIYVEEGPRKGTYAINDTWLEKVVYELSLYNITKKEFSEVKSVLKTMAKHTKPTKDKNLIAVNNGIYDRKNKILKEFSSDYVFMSKCPVNYNVNATNPIIEMPDGVKWDVESWINEIAQDEEVAYLLWQITAASIRPNHGWTKAIWLYSQVGNNGKGTYCELLRNIAGDGNWVSMQVSEFGKEFALGGLLQSSVVITDENDVGIYIDDVANYKAAVTGDSFTVNQKFKDPITASFSGLIVQCMNGFPKTRDKTGSFYRRLLMVPFNKSFTGIERPYIKTDYLKRKDVLEYVLLKILRMDFDNFYEPEICKRVLTQYEEFNDTTIQFWNELRDEFVWDCLPIQFLYDLYYSWFKRNAPYGKPINKMTFTNELEHIIEKDDDWSFRCNRNDRIRVGHKMDKPEYLIIEYNLRGWMKQAYGGMVKDKIVDFDKKQTYRGLLRITTNESSD